ncbi:low affinity iron permease family protein [Patescibacteria group bacterium]|nr:low affinity iron permease family protein [Patescibacteria group bacterium]
MKTKDIFRRFATKVSQLAGTAWAFIIALAIIITWALLGSVFHFSNAWQLFINTFTTIVTLLMVFIIQNTQNRDSKAQHLKLDELLRKLKGTSSNKYVAIEELPDHEIEKLQERFRNLHDKYAQTLEERKRKRKASKK